ncbi:uncharacterized protein [Amphiura filiformis]|uniref:uncharacterized protein n=1 Tax=Amphiura filiformis TaxID=82378 RepID=UPI003B218567
MPETNVCPVPYPCSECPGDLISVIECGGVDDTICDCPRDWYQTGPATCKPIPLCDVNHQRDRVQLPGAEYTSYECAQCSEGMYQPFNNSAELCRPKPKSITTLKPPTRDHFPTSTVPQDKTLWTKSPLPNPASTSDSPDGFCPPIPPCTCDSIPAVGGIAALIILVIIVAYLLYLLLGKVLCKTTTTSHGDYELTQQGEENQAQDQSTNNLQIPTVSSNGNHTRIQNGMQNGNLLKRNGRKKRKDRSKRGVTL